MPMWYQQGHSSFKQFLNICMNYDYVYVGFNEYAGEKARGYGYVIY